MLEQKTVVVNGESYLLTQIPGSKGLKIGRKLATYMAPVFSEVSSGKADIASIVGAVLGSLDDEAEGLIVALVQLGATKNGIAINFDMEFGGKYDLLLGLLKEIVEFNFASVFQVFGSANQ